MDKAQCMSIGKIEQVKRGELTHFIPPITFNPENIKKSQRA